ncbi:MAG: SHOCT domain-containing protein [Halobacteriota archaeon]
MTYTNMRSQFTGIARSIVLATAAVSIAATGIVAAHGGSGGVSNGMAGGWSGGWGGMGLWGGLWMLLLVGIPLLVGYLYLARRSDPPSDRAMETLRDQYARGELSEEEFESRRQSLRRSKIE